MAYQSARPYGPDVFEARGIPPLTEDSEKGRVIDRVCAVALAQPDVVAVADEQGAVSFGELLRGAAQIAEAVAEVNPDRQPVALLRGHNTGAVMAQIGIIGSGAPLVVLDHTTPPARLRQYVEDAGAWVCVTNAEHRAVAAELCPTVVDPPITGSLSLSDAAARLTASPEEPGDPLVIVFTSGSTGRPKGVAFDSRLALHDGWASSVGTGCYGPDDVVASVLPMAFAAGIETILDGLMVGATQQLFDPRVRTVGELPGWLHEVGVTALIASPAILRGVTAAVPPGRRLDGLKVVTMAGETVHGTELAAIRSVVPEDCEIRNRYGSSETQHIAEFVLRPGDPAPEGATPVGRPMPGMRLRVRDESGALHERGTGRLVVTSRWLSLGYWQDRELSAAVFSDEADGSRSYLTSDTGSIDEDGVLRLLGRTDHSVKIRGQLVEPGEIDAVLWARPEIREAVVVGMPAPGSGRMTLVAYVVPAGTRLSATSVRRFVRDVLPGFMVPGEVVLLSALPRTERGKLDRKALPPPPPRTAGPPPRNGWERVVAGLFARVLQHDEIRMDDDFFALGGDSLAAEELLAAMSTELGVDHERLSTALLVEAPTVAEFAEAVRRWRRPEHPTLVTLRQGNGRTPLFCVAGAGGVALQFHALAKRLDDGQPVYGLQAHGLENRGLPDLSVEAMARRHIATIKQVQPEGPYRLAGHSLGGVVALDMAHRLTEAGEQVELLAILDSDPPVPGVLSLPFVDAIRRRLQREGDRAATVGVARMGTGRYWWYHRLGRVQLYRYRARPWSGRSLVLVARDTDYAENRRLWSQLLTGPFDLSMVSGDHMGMLYEPNVADLAELLGAALADADLRRTEQAAETG